MPISVVTGRANAGKTARVEEALLEACADGGVATLLLPSFPDVVRARRGFAERGPFLGLQVTTLDRYLAGMWDTRGDGRGLVGDMQRSVLLDRAVERTSLGLLARSASRYGFARSLAPLARALSGPPRDHPGGAASELLDILQEYRLLLVSEGSIEPSEAVASLAEACESSWFTGPLVLNRFTDLTAAQESFVLAASTAGAEVLMALTWEEGFPATRALDGLVERMSGLGPHERLPSETFTPSAELAYAESHLFLAPEDAIGAPALGDVRLSEAEGEEAEADRIASEVLLAVEDGIPIDRIAVVFREAHERIPALARAFDAAGVPAEYDAIGPLAATGLGRAFAHLVKACAPGARRGQVSAFLRTAFSGADPDEVELLDRRWRRSRESDARAMRATARRELGGATERLLRSAEQLVGERVTNRNSTEWQELAGTMLANAVGGDGGVLAAADAGDAAALRVIVDTIEQAAALRDGLESGDLMRALDRARVGSDVGVRGGVLVTSADRIRGRRFECVIVGGMSASGFGGGRAEHVLRSRDVVMGLAAAGVDPWRQEPDDAERLQFYSVVTRASKRLVLSRQLVDGEGRAVRPSPLLEELLDLYRPPGGPSPAGTTPPVTRLAAGSIALDGEAAPRSRRRALRSVAASGDEAGTDLERSRLRATARRAARRAGTLADERAVAWLAEREVFSVSDIEAYLTCPYRWFYERVLSPRPLDEAIDAGTRGTVVHEALRRFYEALEDVTGQSRLTPENWPDALPLAERCVDEALLSVLDAESFREEGLLVDVRTRVLSFLPQDAEFLPGFAPVGTEIRFEAERFESDGSSAFLLSGRIDRVDRDADGRLAVFDYKTCSVGSAYSVSNAQREGRVQIQLYAHVARRLFEGRPVAGLYREVGPHNLRSRGNRGFYAEGLRGSPGLITRHDDLDDAGIETALDEAVRRAAEAVVSMRAAVIEAEPGDERSCERCACSSRCGRGR